MHDVSLVEPLIFLERRGGRSEILNYPNKLPITERLSAHRAERPRHGQPPRRGHRIARRHPGQAPFPHGRPLCARQRHLLSLVHGGVRSGHGGRHPALLHRVEAKRRPTHADDAPDGPAGASRKLRSRPLLSAGRHRHVDAFPTPYGRRRAHFDRSACLL